MRDPDSSAPSPQPSPWRYCRRYWQTTQLHLSFRGISTTINHPLYTMTYTMRRDLGSNTTCVFNQAKYTVLRELCL